MSLAQNISNIHMLKKIQWVCSRWLAFLSKLQAFPDSEWEIPKFHSMFLQAANNNKYSMKFTRDSHAPHK